MNNVLDRSSASFKKAFMKQMSNSVDELLKNPEAHNLSDESAIAAASAAMNAASAAVRINDRMGGKFYTANKVARLLGKGGEAISRQAISERVRKNRLLRVETSDNKQLFPAFQFHNGKLVPKVADLLSELLPAASDNWVVAYWLTARTELLEGATPVEVLLSGDVDKIDKLFKMAKDDASLWKA